VRALRELINLYVVERLTVTGVNAVNLPGRGDEGKFACDNTFITFFRVHFGDVVGCSKVDILLVFLTFNDEYFGFAIVIRDFMVTSLLFVREVGDCVLFEGLDEVPILNEEGTIIFVLELNLFLEIISPALGILVTPGTSIKSMICSPRVSDF